MALSKVEITSDVFWTCANHALTTESEEIMGLLLGDIKYDTEGRAIARIWVAMPQIRTDRRKDRVEASPEQMAKCSAFAERFSQRSGVRTRVIGWYHSHPHITVLPSHVDVRTQAMYQQLDDGFVGLIFSTFNEDGRSHAQRVQLTAFQSVRQNTLGREMSGPSAAEIMMMDESMREAIAASREDARARADGGAGEWTRAEVALAIVPPESRSERGLGDQAGLLQVLLHEEQRAFLTAFEQACDSEQRIHPLAALQYAATYQRNLCMLAELALGPALQALHTAAAQARLQASQLSEQIRALKKQQLRQGSGGGGPAGRESSAGPGPGPDGGGTAGPRSHPVADGDVQQRGTEGGFLPAEGQIRGRDGGSGNEAGQTRQAGALVSIMDAMPEGPVQQSSSEQHVSVIFPTPSPAQQPYNQPATGATGLQSQTDAAVAASSLVQAYNAAVSSSSAAAPAPAAPGTTQWVNVVSQEYEAASTSRAYPEAPAVSSLATTPPQPPSIRLPDPGRRRYTPVSSASLPPSSAGALPSLPQASPPAVALAPPATAVAAPASHELSAAMHQQLRLSPGDGMVTGVPVPAGWSSEWPMAAATQLGVPVASSTGVPVPAEPSLGIPAGHPVGMGGGLGEGSKAAGSQQPCGQGMGMRSGSLCRQDEEAGGRLAGAGLRAKGPASQDPFASLLGEVLPRRSGSFKDH